MKVTIDEEQIARLSGLKECCACIGYNIPADKDILCKPEVFWHICNVIEDAIKSTKAED